MQLLTRYFVYLFSIFLALGKITPFVDERYVFYPITSVTCIFMLLSNMKQSVKLKWKTTPLLFLLPIIIYIVGSFKVGDDFNFKFFFAIIFFRIAYSFFSLNKDVKIISLIIFSCTSGLISILFHMGFFHSQSDFRNLRLWLFEENPNSLSTRLAFSGVLIVYFVLNLKTNFKYCLLVFLPSLLYLTILTGSRGGIIIFLLGVFVAFYLQKNISIFNKIFLTVLIFCFAYLNFSDFLLNSDLWIRFFESEDLSAHRLDIWAVNLRMFYDSPFGYGELGYIQLMEKLYGDGKDAHNIFLQLLLTGGFLSLIIFVVFISEVFTKSILIYKSNYNYYSILLISLLIFLVSKTGGVMTYIVFWYLLSTIDGYEKNHQKA